MRPNRLDSIAGPLVKATPELPDCAAAGFNTHSLPARSRLVSDRPDIGGLLDPLGH